jgi:hypothetical protein
LARPSPLSCFVGRRWQQCRGEILALAERHNQATDGSLLMLSEYLVAVGHKHG